MEIEEVVVEIVMGLFLLFLSYQVGIKENITFLHSYHYTHLNPKDKKAFRNRFSAGQHWRYCYADYQFNLSF